jgi:hypothetical protein
MGTIQATFVGDGERVQDVKARIERQTGMMAGMQRLVFNGRAMPDNETLSGARDGALFFVQEGKLWDGVQVTVEAPSRAPFTIEITPCRSISAIMEEIGKVTGVPSNELWLACGGTLLFRRDKPESFCGLGEGSRVTVKRKGSADEIVVWAHRADVSGDEDGWAVAVLKTDTIGIVEQKIQAKAGIPAPCQQTR